MSVFGLLSIVRLAPDLSPPPPFSSFQHVLPPTTEPPFTPRPTTNSSDNLAHSQDRRASLPATQTLSSLALSPATPTSRGRKTRQGAVDIDKHKQQSKHPATLSPRPSEPQQQQRQHPHWEELQVTQQAENGKETAPTQSSVISARTPGGTDAGYCDEDRDEEEKRPRGNKIPAISEMGIAIGGHSGTPLDQKVVGRAPLSPIYVSSPGGTQLPNKGGRSPLLTVLHGQPLTPSIGTLSQVRLSQTQLTLGQASSVDDSAGKKVQRTVRGTGGQIDTARRYDSTTSEEWEGLGAGGRYGSHGRTEDFNEIGEQQAIAAVKGKEKNPPADPGAKAGITGARHSSQIDILPALLTPPDKVAAATRVDSDDSVFCVERRRYDIDAAKPIVAVSSMRVQGSQGVAKASDGTGAADSVAESFATNEMSGSSRSREVSATKEAGRSGNSGTAGGGVAGQARVRKPSMWADLDDVGSDDDSIESSTNGSDFGSGGFLGRNECTTVGDVTRLGSAFSGECWRGAAGGGNVPHGNGGALSHCSGEPALNLAREANLNRGTGDTRLSKPLRTANSTLTPGSEEIDDAGSDGVRGKVGEAPSASFLGQSFKASPPGQGRKIDGVGVASEPASQILGDISSEKPALFGARSLPGNARTFLLLRGGSGFENEELLDAALDDSD